jgi:acylglycerol lipase
MHRILFVTLLSLLLTGCAIPAPEPDQAVRDAEPVLELPGEHWVAATDPRATILALHSFSDYHAAFDHLGPWLAERGVTVVGYDQRGFGDAPHPGHWAGTEVMVDDAIRRAEALRADSDAPLYLLGESMGGAVAMLVAIRRPDLVDGLILAAPAVREGIFIRYPYSFGLYLLASLAPGRIEHLNRDPEHPLLRPESAERLARDPNVIREVRMDTYQGLIRMADLASNRAPEVSQPVLLMYGGRDDSIPQVAVEHLREDWGKRVTWRFYPEAPHLLLQGRDWQRAAADIVDWVHSRPAH